MDKNRNHDEESLKKKAESDLIDETSEESFPASDPPGWAGSEHTMNPIEAHDQPMNKKSLTNSFNARQNLSINQKTYEIYSLPAAEQAGLKGIKRLPYSLRILLENLLRHQDGRTVTADDIEALLQWLNEKKSHREIAYRPARVLMQDFTGVPALVDLAAMRDAIKKLGGNPDQINPLSAVDLVIDHSIQVDESNTPHAFLVNAKHEMQRNYERYLFLRWGQKAFQNFRVVPPDTGICHQVNLEYLAKTVWVQEQNGKMLAYPDTLVGTDSHTTMINGLGVLGWGVGGIEAEAAMLGQPISMLIPEVIGVRLTGKLREGVTATDLVLTLTHLLRKKVVVGKFVEYYGPGLEHLSVADRATIANMAPEYGATCGFFPVDQATLDYLHLTGRPQEVLTLIETYCKSQWLWHESSLEPEFTDILELDLTTIEPCLAGPKRPQDQVYFQDLPKTYAELLASHQRLDEQKKDFQTKDAFSIHHGDVVIAAITSCTNTSNPYVLLAAGLLAKKAVGKGLKCKPWVKTSLAPGSQVVTQYLEKTGLQPYLDELGFSLVGYGCTTCIGNSGPLLEPVSEVVNEHDLIVSAVLSGNRNFEGRIHPQVKANWLASPPLVVAFALAGTIDIDLTKDPIGHDQNNQPVFLKDIWPSSPEIIQEMKQISGGMFNEIYADVFRGDELWQQMKIPESKTYSWQADSTYIQQPPFFMDMQKHPERLSEVRDARILALLGDSITTDHISPAGAIKAKSPAAEYLSSKGVTLDEYNSLGSRRGNHEVMMRGTFANIRIRNEMIPGVEGGFTKHYPSEEVLTIYDAAMRYKEENIPLIVIAGKEYGTGSSRDWAAKGPKLLGVVAVVAESFERIHRSNLIGMGILPLEFTAHINRKTLQLTGAESIDILGVNQKMTPQMQLMARIKRADGTFEEFPILSRIDTFNELAYFQNGGILHYVLRNMMRSGY